MGRQLENSPQIEGGWSLLALSVPHRTLPQAYAWGPMVVLGGLKFLMREVPLQTVDPDPGEAEEAALSPISIGQCVQHDRLRASVLSVKHTQTQVFEAWGSHVKVWGQWGRGGEGLLGKGMALR